MLLEAMASGVQIVASDLPSFVDLLGAPQDEQRLGEIFAVGDHRALASAVLQVLDRPNPLRAARARQAARNYDWSSVGATVLAIYRAALSAVPTGRTERHRMSTLEVLGLMIIVVVVLVWRITWLATRVHRATVRAERTGRCLTPHWGRAQRAAELVMMPGIDPATALRLDAAAAALEPELRHGERERPRVT